MFQNDNVSDVTKPKKSFPKAAIIISGIAFTVICLIIAMIIIFNSNGSLESKITKHAWYNDKNQYTLEFYNNGTYKHTFSSGQSKQGKWSINGDVLRINSKKYEWWENLSDKEIKNKTVGNEYYSWYVSDDYFVICDDCVFGSDTSLIYTESFNEMSDNNSFNESDFASAVQSALDSLAEKE